MNQVWFLPKKFQHFKIQVKGLLSKYQNVNGSLIEIYVKYQYFGFFSKFDTEIKFDTEDKFNFKKNSSFVSFFTFHAVIKFRHISSIKQLTRDSKILFSLLFQKLNCYVLLNLSFLKLGLNV